MLKKNSGKGSILKTTIILFSCLLINSVVSADEQTVDAVPVDVVIETKFGDIELKLFSDIAPGHVENFLKLTKSGFYDGTIFHRVIPGFMIQGGDPNSKGSDKSTHGTGGPGYAIDAEFNDKPHVRGALSMARSRDPDSAGSQFFIVVKKSSFLDHQYTVFGEVISGMDVVDEIVSQKRDTRDNPMDRIEVKIRVIELENEMSEGDERS